MTLFSLVFFKVISSLLNILIGFIAGRFHKVERDSIASLLFYYITPIVFFGSPINAYITLNSLSICLITFLIGTLLCLTTYRVAKYFWQDKTRNIVALSAGTGNSGYFSLPIAAAIFTQQQLAIYILALIGVAIYEATIGFYIGTKKNDSVKENIIKMLKLPMLNAFLLGCILSLAGLKLPDFLTDFLSSMRGAYAILGMMMIGLGLSKIQTFKIDYKYLAATFSLKFIFYPLIVGFFIFIDYYLLNIYDTSYYEVLFLISLSPLAANTIVIASINGQETESIASSVLLSSIFAVFYIPIMITIFLN